MSAQLNAEQVTEVIRRWNDGETGRQLAAAFGKTRNAIIGLVHRHGGEDRRTVADFTPKVARVYVPKVKKALPVVVAKTDIVFIGPENDVAPEGCCQYMHGDVMVKGWRMCGHPVRHRKSSWCEVHWHHYVRNPVQPALRNYNRGEVIVQKAPDGRQFNGRSVSGFAKTETRLMEVMDQEPQSLKEALHT